MYAHQVLAVNADNATSNDTMTTHLDGMPNAFDEVNRVRCFNHTLQLSAKTLLRPFNSGLSSGKKGDGCSDGDGDDLLLDEEPDYDEEGTDGDDDALGDDDDDDDDDGVDTLAELSEEEVADLMEATAAVRTAVSKVCLISLFCSHELMIHYRFDNLPLLLSIPLQLHCPHGVRFAKIFMSNQS
jgi:hypothetical protein